MPKRKTSEQPDPLPGCGCRVHKGTVTIDWDTLNAIPDEVVEAFEESSLEAAHAHKSTSPIAAEQAYIRGGIAAVDPLIRVDERSRWARRLREIARSRRDSSGPALLRSIAELMETEAPDA